MLGKKKQIFIIITFNEYELDDENKEFLHRQIRLSQMLIVLTNYMIMYASK